MIALIRRIVNFVLDFKPGNRPNNTVTTAKLSRQAKKTRFRPIHFESYRDGDGLMKIREVVK